MDGVAKAYQTGKVEDIVKACEKLVIPEDTLTFCTDCYTRKLVWTDEGADFSVYLLCWTPGQRSGLHDHPEKGCFMYLLKGCLTVTNYNEREYGVTHNVCQGDYCVQTGAKQLHDVVNNDAPSISLHIYSPTNYVPEFYDEPPPPSFWM